MSPESGQAARDGRLATTDEAAEPAEDGRLATTDEAAEPAADADPARSAEPGAPPAGTGQAAGAAMDPDPVRGSEPSAGPAGTEQPAAPAGDADGPLLGDASGLRASWQRIQSGFVDDPREAVADAAGLVEHAAQALAGALQQRQRRLRALWHDGEQQPADAGRQNAGDVADTERLRLLMRRYRTLFDEICPP